MSTSVIVVSFLTTLITNLIMLLGTSTLVVWVQAISSPKWVATHRQLLVSGLGAAFILFIHWSSWANRMLGGQLAGFHWTFFNVELLVAFDMMLLVKSRLQLTLSFALLLYWFNSVFRHFNLPSLVMVATLALIIAGNWHWFDVINRRHAIRYALFTLYAVCVLNIARLSNGDQDLDGWCRQIIALVTLRLVVDGYYYVLRKYQKRVASFQIQAEYDDLTGLRKLGAFTRDLEQRFNEFNRTGVEYALYSVDIDRFKRINDTYGHLVGSKVIELVAKQLADLFRQVAPDGRVYRTGGEEFTLLMTIRQRDDSEAIYVARLIQQTVSQIDFHTVGVEETITASVGESTVKKDDHSFTDAYKRADQYLYNSKRSGRNLVTVQGRLVQDGTATN